MSRSLGVYPWTMPKDREPERVSLAPLDPVQALKALLAVDPDDEPQKEKKRPKPEPAKPDQAD